MSTSRHAKEIYETDLRSGAYGERRWIMLPIAAFLLVMIAVIGLTVTITVHGYWFLLGLGILSVLLLMIPILIRRRAR